MPLQKSVENQRILMGWGAGNPKNGRPSTILKQAGPQKAQIICAFCDLLSWFDVVLEKLDDVFRGGAGQEYFGDALFLKSWQLFLRHDAADQNKHVIHPFFSKQLNDAWAERIVCATQDRDAYGVNV